MAKLAQVLGGSLVAHIDHRDGATQVALVGKITEAANFALMQLTSPVNFDLSAIEGINSLGVRAWVHFVRDGEVAGLDMTFQRCAPVLVQQISMISNFMGSRSRVTSLFVPYLCPKCNAEELRLVNVTPGTPIAVAPSIPCPKCKTSMQLDELEEMYESLFEKPAAR
ncbi:MAG: hypothetical protein NT062_16430 [Proteobacteria bacterium]|nr:hypothetical protein [Pseudomonadota bacterium]